MPHFWSFVAGFIAAFLVSATAVFAILIWEARRPFVPRNREWWER